MTREKVDELLAGYRQAVGRSGHLEAEVMELTEAIERAERGYYAEVASIGSPSFSDMPRGNSVGSPTERIAIALAAGWKPEYIEEWKKELRQKMDERDQVRLNVFFVKAWLDGLTERERFIIEQQVIDGVYWNEVVAAYKRKYSATASSKDTLKRIKANALEKIYTMAQ